ncbi:MAG: gliding motility-associated C-terminal domain-containing protein, partial [Sphingobacteriales bacterium]
MLHNLRILKALACTLLLFIGIGGVQKTKATHFASGELYLEYIGAGLDGCSGTTEYRYMVTLRLFFACQSDQLTDDSDSLALSFNNFSGWRIFSNNAGINGTTQADSSLFMPPGRTSMPYLKLVVKDTVSQLCPGLFYKNSCNDIKWADSFPAYQIREWKGEIVLPSPQTDWTVSYRNGNRPSKPDNIGGDQYFYIDAVLNNAAKYNNSSPRFLADPLRYICANQPSTFLNGPYDPNGDSIIVKPTDPLIDYNTPAIWISPYGPANPLPTASNNPYKVDPITGTVTFTALNAGKWQLTYKVEKYEKGSGVFLGYSMRDINMVILNCSEPPPAVDSTPITISSGTVVRMPSGAKIIYTCPGNELKFDVATKAVLPNSQLYMEADYPTMPSAAFSAPNNGSSAVTGTFSWTPANADIGDHTLIITSKDSTCAPGSGYTIVQKTATVYTIRVTPGLDLGPDIPICAVNNSPKQLFAKGGEFLRIRWEEISNGTVMPGTPAFLSDPTIHNPIANPNRDIIYRISSPDLVGNCKSMDEIFMKIDSSTMIDAFPDNPVIMCKPDYLQLDARLTGDKPTGNIGCGVLTTIDALERDTVKVIGSAAYGQLAVYDTLGPGTPVLPNEVKSAKMEYLVRKDEMFAGNMRSGTIKSIAFEIKDALSATPQQYKNFTIKMKCTNLKRLNKAAGFQSDNTMTQVYVSPGPLTFAGNTTYHFTLDQPYSWDTMQNLIIQICYANDYHQITCSNPKGDAPTIRFVPTDDVSALFYKAPDTATKDICPVRTDPNIKEYATRPRFTFSYSEAPPTDYQLRWTGNLISDSTIQTPLAYIPRSTTLFVQTYGRSGCIIRDSVEIYVPVRDYKILPGDTAVCYGADAVLKIDKGFHYKWYEYVDGQYRVPAPSTISCVNCREVRLRPLATTTYRIVVYDSVWCTDTIEARVRVLPLPIVKLLNKDTIIRYGASIPLLATGARQYNWLPSGSLSTPNTSAPIATPSERTQYVVMGIGANGCRSYDTVVVDVNKRENVFVPTAFSPNGDGKNDVFRVANMTFQGLMEFRVFNRWGQEIFSTTNAKGGWDGNWNGEPQPVGNYRYIIKVGYPDGHNETY